MTATRVAPERRRADPDGQQSHPGIRAYLYDAQGSDREVTVDASTIEGLGEHELLWVDVVLEHEAATGSLSEWFGIESDDIEQALQPGRRPKLEAVDGYLHLNAVIVAESAPDRFEPTDIHAFVSRNWIVTTHHSALDLVEEFNRPIKGETEIGQLNGPIFLANLLDWALTGYFRVIEALEDHVDDLDEKLLSQEVEQDALLTKLVRLRRRITELRRLLAPHRDVLALLTQPDSNVFTESDSSGQFQRVYDRLEKAIETTDNTREMLIGSFEVFMTQTAQRTNDVMKILTLVSVLLLPCAVIAGILGMNFKVSFFDDPRLFWVAIGIMVALAGTTLFVARRAHWI
jgi:magnesium/cobalt transport protein CorA